FVEKYCSRVVFENDMKWHAWRNPRGRDSVLKALDWLDERGITVRGHCLVWPSWRNSNPQWREISGDKDALATAVREHVAGEAGDLAGRVVDWDVVNEIWDNHDILDILGRDVLVEWFKTAREADPNVRLFINDYGILSGQGMDKRKQDFYFKTIQELLAAGAPIGGVGMQGHFGQTATPPEKIIEILDRFAELGLGIAITEHDVDSADETYKAEFTRDLMTAAFACPAVDSFLVWGFWERAHWRPQSAYFRADWTPTDAGRVWMEYVGEKWRSNLDAETAENGEFAARVFHGDYKIAVRVADSERVVEAKVSKDGAELEICLK
ncbi:MAG: endo-1,4-beta-xylanase, partial [Thermoguttaceae bacterium]|nr:endo-1,4-beta-xylanase [Thermoguttaceae bacterium]